MASRYAWFDLKRAETSIANARPTSIHGVCQSLRKRQSHHSKRSRHKQEESGNAQGQIAWDFCSLDESMQCSFLLLPVLPHAPVIVGRCLLQQSKQKSPRVKPDHCMKELSCIWQGRLGFEAESNGPTCKQTRMAYVHTYRVIRPKNFRYSSSTAIWLLDLNVSAL